MTLLTMPELRILEPEEHSPENVALVDLDGTLADYDKAMSAKLAQLASPEENYTHSPHDPDLPPHIDRRRKEIQKQHGFWENLEVIEENMVVLDLMKENGYDIHILTNGPRKCPHAWTEKVVWCQRHLWGNDAIGNITITRNKGLVYGKVLFDDFPEYVMRWLKWRKRGLAIMPLLPWNKDLKHPNILHFNGKNIDEINEALKKRKAH